MTINSKVSVILKGVIMTKSIIKQQVKRHLSLVSATEVQAVCEPLATHFGIKSLVYKSIKNDGREVVLSTHPEWVDYFFEHGLYKGSALEKEPSNYVHGELLWNHIKTHSEILTATSEGFDIANGITLIRPYEDGCEFYYFGASQQNYKANQILNNNIDLLDKFAHYFKYKMDSVLQKVREHPMRIPGKFDDNELSVHDIPCYQSQAKRAGFLNDLYKDGIHLSVGGRAIHLTKREHNVATEFMKGKTMSQIADELFLSPRTIESHLDNIKMKFRVRKKPELLVILSKLL